MPSQSVSKQRKNRSLKKQGSEREVGNRPDGWSFALFFIGHLFGFLGKALWPGTVVLSSYFVYLAAAALAGKDTSAIINSTINWQIDVAIAYVVGTGGVAYGLYERALRKRIATVERQRNEEYERLADPERTSSGLLPGGDVPS